MKEIKTADRIRTYDAGDYYYGLALPTELLTVLKQR